jgi:hypothetical protein
VPELAWKVFRSCEQSSSDFKGLASEVSELHIALRLTREMLETDTFSMDYRPKIHEISEDAYEVLQEIQSMMEKYEAFGVKSQKTWDRMGFGLDKLSELRTQLQADVARVNEFNAILARFVKSLRRFLGSQHTDSWLKVFHESVGRES